MSCCRSLLLVVVLVLVAAPAAFAQDEPRVSIPDPDAPFLPMPYELTDRLPDPKERHPWVPGECGNNPDGCPFPLLYEAVEGSYKNPSEP